MIHTIINYYNLSDKKSILLLLEKIKYLIIKNKKYEIKKVLNDDDNEISLEYWEKIDIIEKEKGDYDIITLVNKIILEVKKQL